MQSTAVNASRDTSAETKQLVTPTQVETKIKELITLAKDAGTDQFLVSTARHVV